MSRDVNHGSLWVVGIKSIIFTIVTVFATAMLASTIMNSSEGQTTTYTAVFNDVTSVNKGDEVRVAGVKVGSVDKIAITDKRLATVTFRVRKGVRISADSVVQIKFRNLVGQRYLSIQEPDTSSTSGSSVVPASTSDAVPVASTAVKTGTTFDLEHTRGALDLTVLFNGFRPLLRMLNPDDVNNLSAQIVAVFQGEDATVDGLLKSTASLTTTLAQKDQVIGELITSLSSVLQSINERSGQLDTTLVTMQQLVSGLSSDRAAIGSSLAGMGELTTRVSTLVEGTREPLRQSIQHIGVLADTLNHNSDKVQQFLTNLPVKLNAIGRTASYGSWLNTYLCSMNGRIPIPEGYMGSIGAVPLAERCR
ncbi:MlaD family protein [Nocardioides sp.]|uniref:MCE family protein n=1 Tax=Nocardioides sp. TaxID=35761 RepID=UPI002633850F|nr:MlaD family protein [Nocardioides sp.]